METIEQLEDNHCIFRNYWAGEDDIVDAMPNPLPADYEEVQEQDDELELAIQLDIEPWYQNDKRWASIPYGPNKTWTTYAQAGCGCLSYAMVMEYYGLFSDSLETTKDKVIALGTYAYKHGFRKKNKGTSSGLFYTWTDCTRTKKVQDVFDAIDDGSPVILLVRADWSTYKGSGHYVVCYGYTADKQYLLINDPASCAVARRKVKIAGNWNSVAYAYICSAKGDKLN